MHERARKRLIAELVEGNARLARDRPCRYCGADVVEGDDDDRVALVVRVEPDPIDPLDEWLAYLDDRRTFTLERQTGKTARPGTYALYARDRWQIASTRPIRGTLHHEHECDPDVRKAFRNRCNPPTLFD